MKNELRKSLITAAIFVGIFIALGDFSVCAATTLKDRNIQKIQNDVERESLLKAFREIKLAEQSNNLGLAAQNLNTQQTKLLAADGGADDTFGRSVAISGNTAVIGAVGADLTTTNFNEGAIYVFERNGTSFVQAQKLTASDAAPNYNLGYSVAISNNTILAGAPFGTIGSNQSQGSAYIFGGF